MARYIKATRTVEITYDLDSIMADYNVDEAGAMEQIRDYAAEDFSCGHGHTIDVDEVDFVEFEEE